MMIASFELCMPHTSCCFSIGVYVNLLWDTLSNIINHIEAAHSPSQSKVSSQVPLFPFKHTEEYIVQFTVILCKSFDALKNEFNV